MGVQVAGLIAALIVVIYNLRVGAAACGEIVE